MAVEADVDVDAVTDTPESPRRRHTGRQIAVAVAVVVGLLVAVLATRDPATTRVADSPLVGRPAPDLAGEGLTAAGGFDLGAVSGRWVLVNFFATWCVPCVREHPELVSFSRRHEAAGDARVVSVVFGDADDEVAEFFAERGGDWPVVSDSAGTIAVDWGVSGVPESYLVDPRGVVRAKITGGVEVGGLDELLARASVPAGEAEAGP